MNRPLAGFIAFVVALAATVGLVWPKANEIKHLGVDEQAKSRLASARQTKLDALIDLESAFSAQSDRVAKIVSILPTEPEIPEALTSLEAIARVSGLTVTSLTPQLDETSRAVVVLGVGEGDMAAIETFMTNVAANDRPISLTTLALARSSDGKKMTMTFGLSFAYRPRGAS